MAPPNEILAVLGDLEWAAIGGTINIQYHPSGRVSYIYIAPHGGEKFRSWKQALVYMGEDESGGLAQQARERHNSILKSSSKSPNPRAIQKRRQKSSSWLPYSAVPTQLEQQATGAGSGGCLVTRISLQSSPQLGTHFPRLRSKNLFQQAVALPPTGDSSLPPIMNKRNLKEALGGPKVAPGNRTKKFVSPSTFTGATIFASGSLPKNSNTMFLPSNSLAKCRLCLSLRPEMSSESSSRNVIGDDNNKYDNKYAQPPLVIKAESSHVEPPPKEPIKT